MLPRIAALATAAVCALAVGVVPPTSAEAGNKRPPVRNPRGEMHKPYRPPANEPRPTKTGAEACAELTAELYELGMTDVTCDFRAVEKSRDDHTYDIAIGPKLTGKVYPPQDDEFWKRMNQITKHLALAHKNVQETTTSATINLWGGWFIVPLEYAWRCGTDFRCTRQRTEVVHLPE